MGDDEARREEAREEAAIERCLRNGTMILCPICNIPTTRYFTYLDSEDQLFPLCRRCRDRREEDEDGMEEE